MNRREVLRLLSAGIPAGMLAPSLFSSCRKQLFDGISYKGKVIIIGAGAAGLYSAYLLQQHGVDATILEASSVYGGRIRPLDGFSDFTIELGAEEIHGQRSVYYDLVRSTDGVQLIDSNNTGEDYILIDGSLKKLSSLDKDPDIKAVNHLVNKLGDVYDGGDVTAEQYIQQKNFAQRVYPLLDAYLGNEYGTSNDRLGIKGAATDDNLWTSGDSNYLLKNRSILSVLEERLTGIFDRITLNTQVKQVDYSGSNIILTDQNANTFTADRVIVTVPLPVLRDGDITFLPAPDASRTGAFSRIGMGPGMKVILQFTSRFWADDTSSIYGTGIIPEYWATGAAGKSALNNVLTAFVHGANAETLIAMGSSGMISAILADLDVIYGAGVASNNLQNSYIMNWTQEPFIKGTYSYPVVGGEGAREIIAAPLDGRIFFAGEATHTAGEYATVHGAMETGMRAVQELFNSVK